MGLSWMAWTFPTAVFFAVIFALVAAMGVWEWLRPGGAPRRGLLGITTTRGDRLFISLLCAAYIHMGWLAFLTLPLWGATVASVAAAVFIFRRV